MNREYTVEEFNQVVDTIRCNVKGAHISTDIICGFPGETEEEFDDTMALVEKYKFPSVYISQFYPRPGTPAASMKRVDTKVVKDRSRRITKLFESYTCHDSLLGSIQTVWLRDFEEGRAKDQMIGHTKNFAKVILPRKEELIGGSVTVRIVETHKWHVVGEFYIPPPPSKWTRVYLVIALIVFALAFVVTNLL
jgi:threonylcarbamoyladenosine tRNA methylthiotransferase CDKAL1